MKTIISCLLFLFSMSSFAQNLLAEHHFEAEGINHVEISGSFCDVTVSSGNKLIFDGQVKGSGDFGDYVISSTRNGNTVLFKVERKADLRNIGFNSVSGKLELVLPKEAALKVKNTSGDIRVEDYNSEELHLATTSGSIRITEIIANCHLRATSGDISGRQLTGDLDLTTTSGNQSMTGVNGEVNTVSTSGDITLSGVEGYVSAQATSGNIHLNDISGRISVNTTSGNIEGSGIRLAGESRFKATSGNVSMELVNDPNEVGFDLSATSGNIRLDDKRIGNKLVIAQGSIFMKGNTTSGNIAFRF